jgi:V8-like Glu-specific endopeptidase
MKPSKSHLCLLPSLISCLILFMTLSVSGQDNYQKLAGQFVYPIYTIINTSKATGNASCFFIKYDSAIWLVTACHVFFDFEKKQLREGKFINVFLSPDNPNEIGWAFPIEPRKMRIDILKDSTYIDIIAFPVIPPKGINLVDISPHTLLSKNQKGKEILITGYPNESLNVIESIIVDWQENFLFYSCNPPSTLGASGAPVFLRINSKLYFAGIYTGRNKKTNEGTIYKPNVLGYYLDSFIEWQKKR